MCEHDTDGFEKWFSSVHSSGEFDTFRTLKEFGRASWDAARNEYESNKIIEKCAVAAETHVRGTQYQWMSGSLFGNLVKQISGRIRALKDD